MVEVRPGQLWRIKPLLTERSFAYIATPVTDAARQFLTTDTMIIGSKDVMMVVVADDEGPYETPVFDPNTFAMKPKGRYHVVLAKDRMAWIRHDWLVDGSELLRDVE